MPTSLYKENVGVPSVSDRQWLGYLTGNRTGRFGENDFNITLTTGLGYTVGPGKLAVANALTDGKDSYIFSSSTPLTRASGAANSSNPRNDLIVAKITDSYIAGTGDVDDVVVLTGTPAGTPADPPLPSDGNYTPLWRVRVGAGVQTLTNANFTDLRPQVIGLAGTPQPVLSATEQATLGVLRPGSAVWREDLKHPQWYGFGGSVYDPIADLTTHVANSDTVFSQSLAQQASLLGLGGLQVGPDYKTAPQNFSGIAIQDVNLFGGYGTVTTYSGGNGALQVWVNASNQGANSTTDATWCSAAFRTKAASSNAWSQWHKLMPQAERQWYANRFTITQAPDGTYADGTTWYTPNLSFPANRFTTVPTVTATVSGAQYYALSPAVYVYGVSTTGFSVRVAFLDGFKGDFYLNIIAMPTTG